MSYILLDTHAFIWLSEDDLMLPASLRDRIEQTDNVFVSIASFWEISIKLSLGKLALTTDFNDIETKFNYCPSPFKTQSNLANCHYTTEIPLIAS